MEHGEKVRSQYTQKQSLKHYISLQEKRKIHAHQHDKKQVTGCHKTEVIAMTRYEIEFLKNIPTGQPITYPSQN